jgi:peptide/nickel transport system substrate-binding protein
MAVFARRLRDVFAVVAIALSACSGTGVGTRWGAPHELRIGFVNDPSSLNPLFVTSQNAVDMGQLYTETLVGLSPKNELIPLVAQRIPTRANGDISADGLTITYHLRRNERFADGVPLTSADVAFTYRVILDARNPVTSAEPYRQIASLTTPDPYTVRIRLRHRWAAATSELFAVSDYAFGILPSHVFNGSTDLSRSAWNEKPFGSGPFMVERWQHGDRIVLRPNPYARRKPHLSRLVFKIVPDQGTLFIQLRTHAIDIADLTEKQAIRAREMPGIRLTETQQNHTDFIEFQTTRPPTDNPSIRRALIEAIDRNAIARNVYYGLHPLATTEIPSTLWAHDASIEAVPYNPQRARSDLAKAGWKRGTALDFAYIGSSEESRVLATLVQANLAAVGVKLVLHTYPSTLYFAPAQSGGIVRGGRFNLAYSDWFGGADPEQSETYRCGDRAPSGPNTSRWCDARYDALYRRQAETLDRTARTRIFSAMQRLVNQAAVDDFLVYQSLYTAANPVVQGYQPNMLFKFGNSEYWDVP